MTIETMLDDIQQLFYEANATFAGYCAIHAAKPDVEKANPNHAHACKMWDGYEKVAALRAAVEAVKVEVVDVITDTGVTNVVKLILYNCTPEKGEAIKALLTGKPPGESA